MRSIRKRAENYGRRERQRVQKSKIGPSIPLSIRARIPSQWAHIVGYILPHRSRRYGSSIRASLRSLSAWHVRREFEERNRDVEDVKPVSYAHASMRKDTESRDEKRQASRQESSGEVLRLGKEPRDSFESLEAWI